MIHNKTFYHALLTHFKHPEVEERLSRSHFAIVHHFSCGMLHHCIFAKVIEGVLSYPLHVFDSNDSALHAFDEVGFDGVETATEH